MGDYRQYLHEIRAYKGHINRLKKKVQFFQAENDKLKKWQIKPTEAICLTDLSCRYKKVFKSDSAK